MTTPITMQAVESSQIHSIGHDPASNKLAIRFKTKDGAPSSLYHYQNLTPEEFEAFRKAESVGSHFYKHIKPFADRYPYERIEEKPAATPADAQAE